MYLKSIRHSISFFRQLGRKTYLNPKPIRMASTLPNLPVFEAIANHDPKSIAVVHCKSGRRFTYGELLRDVADGRNSMRQAAGEQDMKGQRVAFLVENGYDYVGANRSCIRDIQYRQLITSSNITFHSRQ